MKLQLLALLCSILFKTTNAQCPNDFSSPQFQSTYTSPIDVDWTDFFCYGLQEIEGKIYYYYYLDATGLTLQLHDLNSIEILEFSLEPLRDFLLEYSDITFLDLNTVCVIAKNEIDIILFDLLEGEIKDVLSFNEILRPLELLYIHPEQKVKKMGDYLIIPTIFGEVNYSDIESRKMIQKSAPFVLYDLKLKKPFISSKGSFWPKKYSEELHFDDFLPNIFHDGKSTVYFNYKYSDTLYAYSVVDSTLRKHALNLRLNFPENGLFNGNPDVFKRFKTENTFISKYFFHPSLRKHILFIKPKSKFRVENRLTSVFEIRCHLFILDEDLKLNKKYCISPKEAEWYISSINSKQIILPSSNMEKSKGPALRTFKGLNIEN